MVTSGVRIGTPAVTTRGMKEAEMDKIAEYIDKVLSNIGSENVYNEVRTAVADLCKRFPVYG
jgi:glycine hydroxymethyltransferase